MSDIEDLLDEYFSIGFREGRENRNHDDILGSAQLTREKIRAAFRADRTYPAALIGQGNTNAGEVERLRAALEPFAREADCYEPDTGDDDDAVWATPAYFKIRDLRRARAALAHQPLSVPHGWQPIKTAPKDGSQFQAWIDKYGWEPNCRINPETEAFEIFGRVDYDADGYEVYPHMIPTHWQPLPASPKPTEGEAE